MPANLPPQYVKLEAECRGEKDPQRRLELLQEMLTTIPKHKGTSHLQGEIKAKISKIRQALDSGQKKSTGARQASLDHVPKEGAGQFVLFGPPNSGKSSILGATTHAHVEIAEWPFATRRPIPGMAPWKNIQLQLVDTPSIAPEFCEDYVFNIIRIADVAVLVLSLGDDDLLEELEFVVEKTHEHKVRLEGLADVDPNRPMAKARKTLIAATGLDQPDADTRLALLTDAIANNVVVMPMSIPERRGIDEFLAHCFGMLGLQRVYSKAPGHDPDREAPILLVSGSTVADAARSIHKDFAEGFQFARLWSATNHAFQGQRVPADHIVEEGDVLEFHA